MPYADPERQRIAVNVAVKRVQAQRKAGRPVGRSTYVFPAQVEAAIQQQKHRLSTLEAEKARYQPNSKKYRNVVSYISEAKARIAKLETQLEEMTTKPETPNKLHRETVDTMLGYRQGVVKYEALWGKKDPLGYNCMYFEYDDGRRAVGYHKTDIVTGWADGSVVLDSGGYAAKSQKTRERIARYALWFGIRITLFVKGGACYYTFTDRDHARPFVDGMVIAPASPPTREDAAAMARRLVAEYKIRPDELFTYAPAGTGAEANA